MKKQKLRRLLQAEQRFSSFMGEEEKLDSLTEEVQHQKQNSFWNGMFVALTICSIWNIAVILFLLRGI